MAQKKYYIVNPSGTVHQVNRDHASRRLRQVGFRLATKAEIAKLKRAKGKQTTRKRIAEPWAPEVDDRPDIDELLGGGGEGSEADPPKE